MRGIKSRSGKPEKDYNCTIDVKDRMDFNFNGSLEGLLSYVEKNAKEYHETYLDRFDVWVNVNRMITRNKGWSPKGKRIDSRVARAYFVSQKWNNWLKVLKKKVKEIK